MESVDSKKFLYALNKNSTYCVILLVKTMLKTVCKNIQSWSIYIDFSKTDLAKKVSQDNRTK